MISSSSNSTRKYIPLAACLAASLITSACGTARSTRGYIFDPELAQAIMPGVDNRQSVRSTLGTPTLSATFDDQTWYYVSTTVRVRPVFWPDPKAHLVMAIRFDEGGVVDTIDNYDMADMRSISPVDDKTPTKGRKLSFFQQIFGTIGRFSGQAPVGADQTTGPNG